MLRVAHRHWRRAQPLPAFAHSSVSLHWVRSVTKRRKSTVQAFATKLARDHDDCASNIDTARNAPRSGLVANLIAHSGTRAIPEHSHDEETSPSPRLKSVQDRFLYHGLKRTSRRNTTNQTASRLTKSWKGASATQLLRQVLLHRTDSRWPSWIRTVAALRSRRLSVVVLQLMLRDGMLRHAISHGVMPLLPDDRTWQEITVYLEKQGHSIDRLRSYAYILSAQSNKDRIRRFLDRDEFKPMFLFGFLLRCGVDTIENLEELIRYCRRWYTLRRDGPHPWQTSVPLLTVDFNDHGHPLRLLIENCYRLDPRRLPDIAEMMALMLGRLSKDRDLSDERVEMRQSRIFNQVLCLFPQSNYGVYPQRKLPSAYTWAAVELLLSMSASLERPCSTSLKGFRAIKEVMASQTRDQKDMRIIPRLSNSWPPYLLPSDGMDEVAEPDENWSRTVLASAFMQENGYSKEEADLALDILQGMAPNGSPTIHQHETIARAGGMRLWEASIMATRDSVEAWQIFQRCPGDPAARPTIREYTAMFQKLLYRDVGPSEKAFPGDRNLNFPSSSYNSFTELERLRLEPPTVDQLYTRMRSDNVALSSKCLRLLVRHAHSPEDVSNYILESTLPEEMKKAFLTWEAWDTRRFSGRRASEIAAKTFPVFAMAVIRLNSPTAHRIREIVSRAVDVLQMAGADAQRHMAGFWPFAMRALGQSSVRLRANPDQHLKAILQTARLIEDAGQMSLATFVKFANTVRRFASAQLNVLSENSSMPNTLLDFYDPDIRAMQYETKMLGDGGHQGDATSIDDSMYQGLASGLTLAASALKRNYAMLVQKEQHAQALHGEHSVPPLERMVNRQDPVQAEQVRSLILALAHLGDFEEAARVLGWALTEWMETDVVDALRYLDDDAGFHPVLCLFRTLVEPMLPTDTAQDLRALVTSERSPFRWPSGNELDAFTSTLEGASILRLALVLDQVQQRQARRTGQDEDSRKMTYSSSSSSTVGGRTVKHETVEDPGVVGNTMPVGCERPFGKPDTTSRRWHSETGGLRFVTGKF